MIVLMFALLLQILGGTQNVIRAGAEVDTSAYYVVSSCDTTFANVVFQYSGDTIPADETSEKIVFRDVSPTAHMFEPEPAPDPGASPLAWIVAGICFALLTGWVFYRGALPKGEAEQITGYYARIDAASNQLGKLIQQLDEWNWRKVKGAFVKGQEWAERPAERSIPDVYEEALGMYDRYFACIPTNPNSLAAEYAALSSRPIPKKVRAVDPLQRYAAPCPTCGEQMHVELYNHGQRVRIYCPDGHRQTDRDVSEYERSDDE